jgi:beta-phosphoglucomutase-like phosphatase (HAD superfamily)
MEINLKGIGLTGCDFDIMVNGLEVERKKPFPDIYLTAAEKLGLNPAECLVVEDAVSGVKAGKTAGCKVLAVTTSFSPEKLHEADWICDSLADVPEEVLRW